MARHGEELEARRVRRQKVFVIIGAAVLLGILAFQLPGLLSSGSGSSPGPAGSVSVAAPVHPAAPVAKPIPSPSAAAAVRGLGRLQARDLFVPQVHVGSSASLAAASGPALAKGPAVRAKNFVTKDPFVPQVTVPTAPAEAAKTVTVAPSLAPTPADIQAGGSYIVILGVIQGTSDASRKAAAHAIVAAKNAGLKDVTASAAVPGTGSKAHYTVFTGPYPSAAMAHFELVRALRNGYPHASTERFGGGSSKKGF
jgi:hypothetical protein